MLKTVGTPAAIVILFSFSQRGNLDREKFCPRNRVAPEFMLVRIERACAEAQLYRYDTPKFYLLW
jgi:hypothetical protein